MERLFAVALAFALVSGCGQKEAALSSTTAFETDISGEPGPRPAGPLENPPEIRHPQGVPESGTDSFSQDSTSKTETSIRLADTGIIGKWLSPCLTSEVGSIRVHLEVTDTERYTRVELRFADAECSSFAGAQVAEGVLYLARESADVAGAFELDWKSGEELFLGLAKVDGDSLFLTEPATSRPSQMSSSAPYVRVPAFDPLPTPPAPPSPAPSPEPSPTDAPSPDPVPVPVPQCPSMAGKYKLGREQFEITQVDCLRLVRAWPKEVEIYFTDGKEYEWPSSGKDGEEEIEKKRLWISARYEQDRLVIERWKKKGDRKSFEGSVHFFLTGTPCDLRTPKGLYFVEETLKANGKLDRCAYWQKQE